MVEVETRLRVVTRYPKVVIDLLELPNKRILAAEQGHATFANVVESSTRIAIGNHLFFDEIANDPALSPNLKRMNVRREIPVERGYHVMNHVGEWSKVLTKEPFGFLRTTN